MKRVRRAVALIANLLLLQLLLTGSGTTCGQHESGLRVPPGQTHGQMADMSGDHNCEQSDSACGSGDTSPCSSSDFTGSCATMATCNATAATIAPSFALGGVAPELVKAASTVFDVRNPVRATDVPPPRA